jgi:alpha-ketoglutarate-dependent 2,4-dichlorophenoxyacetate dioxygenase
MTVTVSGPRAGAGSRQSAAVTFERLRGTFAAKVTGLDLTEPLDAETIACLDGAMAEHAVLIFEETGLDEEGLHRFARAFGELDIGFKRVSRAPTRFKFDETLDMSNVGAGGEIVPKDHRKIVGNIANQLWHTDSSFQKPTAKYSFLLSEVITSWGGETEFVDMRAAHDRLPEPTKARLSGLVAEHDALHSRLALGDTRYDEEQRKIFPPVDWPILRQHPSSGAAYLYIGAHAHKIHGMTVPEARMLLMDLLEQATQPEYVHQHKWRVGDLVLWDNRTTLHRGRAFDLAERRELKRVSTLDDEGGLASR